VLPPVRTIRVKITAKVFHLHVYTDVGVGDESDAFLFQQLHATENDFLSSLNCGMPLGEQAADFVGPLEDAGRCARPYSAGGTRQTRRA